MAFPFLCLLVGRRPPMPLWVFVAFGFIMMLCGATLPIGLFGLMLKVLFIPVIALSSVAGVVVLIRAAVVDRNVVAHLMIGPVLVAILLAAHDHSLLANLSGEPRVLLTRYSPGRIQV